MKITAKEGAYSGVVGGGVLLLGAKGKMVGQVAFLALTDRKNIEAGSLS